MYGIIHYSYFKVKKYIKKDSTYSCAVFTTNHHPQPPSKYNRYSHNVKKFISVYLKIVLDLWDYIVYSNFHSHICRFIAIQNYKSSVFDLRGCTTLKIGKLSGHIPVVISKHLCIACSDWD